MEKEEEVDGYDMNHMRHDREKKRRVLGGEIRGNGQEEECVRRGLAPQCLINFIIVITMMT